MFIFAIILNTRTLKEQMLHCSYFFTFCSLVFNCKILYYISNLSCQKVVFYLKAERGTSVMTNSDLILKLVEMLLNERTNNNELQAKLEENKKSEG